ncbi:hypothetical protein [Amycolatopsis suaedae]|uniref:hypothetical protein n=1 Tax=Amycolatopsis suaedae TaxID=2510978 RepID=UPI0013EF0A56|nr:hypothetical protein [Amycolatopsis suaedae]
MSKHPRLTRIGDQLDVAAHWFITAIAFLLGAALLGLLATGLGYLLEGLTS